MRQRAIRYTILLLLLLQHQGGASVVAPWSVGPLGEGGIGALFWGENRRNIAAAALPWSIDGTPHYSSPFWHLQGSLPLFLELLKLELLWNRHPFDTHQLQALATSLDDPQRERALTRHQERAARLLFSLPGGWSLIGQAAWRESEGSWQHKSDRGWLQLSPSWGGAEWFYGGGAEWRESGSWKQQTVLRIEAIGSRDGELLYEGWEWQLLAGTVRPVGSRSTLQLLIEAALPHWEPHSWPIDSLNWLALPNGKELRSRVLVGWEWPQNRHQPEKSRWGPVLQLETSGANLVSSQLLLQLAGKLQLPRLEPLGYWLQCGGDLQAQENRGAFLLNAGLSLDLPGAVWLFKNQNHRPIRTTIGWFESPSAALPHGIH